jgi:hypothetical protein
MKSIMEEASSIVKAIEKGWVKAGQPKEFSVKIFEEPQKNFIGLTVRSAKIGIFFTDKQPNKVQDHPATKQKQVNQPRPTPSAPAKEPNKPQSEAKSKAHTKHKDISATSQDLGLTKQAVPAMQQEQKPIQPIWTESMINDVGHWLRQTLEIINIPAITFTLDPRHFHLKIQLSGPIFEDKSREKQLFASLATLLIQMLKQRYKRPLKGYKIILIGG